MRLWQLRIGVESCMDKLEGPGAWRMEKGQGGIGDGGAGNKKHHFGDDHQRAIDFRSQSPSKD